MIIAWVACALDYKNISTPNVISNFDRKLAIAESYNFKPSNLG